MRKTPPITSILADLPWTQIRPIRRPVGQNGATIDGRWQLDSGPPLYQGVLTLSLQGGLLTGTFRGGACNGFSDGVAWVLHCLPVGNMSGPVLLSGVVGIRLGPDTPEWPGPHQDYLSGGLQLTSTTPGFGPSLASDFQFTAHRAP